MNKLIIESEIARRMFAGMWFALAAAVPVGYFFTLDPFSGKGLPILGNSVILTIAAPIFVSSICGLALGADILNAEETKNALQAIGRGLAVGLLSYFFVFFASAVVLVLVGEDAIGIIIFCVFLFLYGLLFLGWLVAIVGATAGGLLYFFRLKTFGRER